jgi:hypothetical protein
MTDSPHFHIYADDSRRPRRRCGPGRGGPATATRWCSHSYMAGLAAVCHKIQTLIDLKLKVNDGSEKPKIIEGRRVSETTEFTIGSDVFCSDGACGELRRVVVDPIARALTHLVVAEKHRRGRGHLVPIDLVDSSGVEIHLQCTTAQFEALAEAQETQFLPGAGGHWGYGQDQLLSQPYYGLGMGGMGAVGMGGMGMGGMGMSGGPQPITYDRVPAGEVATRAG